MYTQETLQRQQQVTTEDTQTNIGNIGTQDQLEYFEPPLLKTKTEDDKGGKLDTPKPNKNGVVTLTIDADANQKGRELRLDMQVKDNTIHFLVTYLPTGKTTTFKMGLGPQRIAPLKIYGQRIGDGYEQPYRIFFTKPGKSFSSNLSRTSAPVMDISLLKKDGKFRYKFAIYHQEAFLDIPNYVPMVHETKKNGKDAWRKMKKEDYLIQSTQPNTKETNQPTETYNQKFKVPITVGHYKDKYVLELAKFTGISANSAVLTAKHIGKKGGVVWGGRITNQDFLVPIPDCVDLRWQVIPFPTYSVIKFFDGSPQKNNKTQSGEQRLNKPTEIIVFHQMQGQDEGNREARLWVKVPKKYKEKASGALSYSPDHTIFSFKKFKGKFVVDKSLNHLGSFKADASRHAEGFFKDQKRKMIPNLQTYDEFGASIRMQEDQFIHKQWTENSYFNQDKKNLVFYWQYRNMMSAFELLKTVDRILEKDNSGKNASKKQKYVDKATLARIENLKILVKIYKELYDERKKVFDDAKEKKREELATRPKSDYFRPEYQHFPVFEGAFAQNIVSYVETENWKQVDATLARIRGGVLDLTKSMLRAQLRKPEFTLGQRDTLLRADSIIEGSDLLGRQLDKFVGRHKEAPKTMRSVQAIFYPESEYLKHFNLDPMLGIPLPLFYCKDKEKKQWLIFNPLSPKSKEGFVESVPLTDDEYPPAKLFEQLSHPRSFPRGILYYHIDGEGKKYPPIETKGGSTWGDDLKLLGGILFFVGLAIGTGGASLAANIVMLAGAASGGIGAALNEWEGQRTESISSLESALNYVDIASSFLALAQSTKLIGQFAKWVGQGVGVTKTPKMVSNINNLAKSVSNTFIVRGGVFLMKVADMGIDGFTVVYGNATALEQIFTIYNQPISGPEKAAKIIQVLTLAAFESLMFTATVKRRFVDIKTTYKQFADTKTFNKIKKGTFSWVGQKQGDKAQKMAQYTERLNQTKLFAPESTVVFLQNVHPKSVERMLEQLEKLTPMQKAEVAALNARYTELETLYALYYSRGNLAKTHKVLGGRNAHSKRDAGEKVYKAVYDAEYSKQNIVSKRIDLKRRLKQEKQDHQTFEKKTKDFTEKVEVSRDGAKAEADELTTQQAEHSPNSKAAEYADELAEGTQRLQLYQSKKLLPDEQKLAEQKLNEQSMTKEGQQNAGELRKSLQEMANQQSRIKALANNRSKKSLLLDLLNHASQATLLKVFKGTGVGKASIEAIIKHRKKNPITSVDDLAGVTTAGGRKLKIERIKKVTLRGESAKKLRQQARKNAATRLEKARLKAYQQYEQYQQDQAAVLKNDFDKANKKFKDARDSLDDKMNEFYDAHTGKQTIFYGNLKKEKTQLDKVNQPKNLDKNLEQVSKTIQQEEAKFSNAQQKFKQGVKAEVERVKELYRAKEDAREAYARAREDAAAYARLRQAKATQVKNQQILQKNKELFEALQKARKEYSEVVDYNRGKPASKKKGTKRLRKRYLEARQAYHGNAPQAKKARQELQASEKEVWLFERDPTQATKITADLHTSQNELKQLQKKRAELVQELRENNQKNKSDRLSPEDYRAKWQKLRQIRWQMEQKAHEVALLEQRKLGQDEVAALNEYLPRLRAKMNKARKREQKYLTEHIEVNKRQEGLNARLSAYQILLNARQQALDNSSTTQHSLSQALKASKVNFAQLNKAKQFQKAALIKQQTEASMQSMLLTADGLKDTMWKDVNQTKQTIREAIRTWQQMLKKVPKRYIRVKFQGHLQSAKAMWKLCKVLLGILKKLWRKEEYPMYSAMYKQFEALLPELEALLQQLEYSLTTADKTLPSNLDTLMRVIKQLPDKKQPLYLASVSTIIQYDAMINELKNNYLRTLPKK